jgi:prophage antirepressor-like protein
MTKNQGITDSKHQAVLFENLRIRRTWHDEQWYYSVVDVVGMLTDNEYQTARKYWKVLRGRLIDEGVDQLVTNCYRLKMIAEDGKQRETDCANARGLLRIIQSIPSKKAEPFKQWLAKVGHERLQEISDPAQAVDRAREYWKKHGRSEKWIQQRMMGQETRNKLTDYWREHDISDGEGFAILTNIIHQEWTGLSVKEHKDLKGLSTQNLRDHMSEEELIFTALAELSTRKIAETDQATGMSENKVAARKGGKVAQNAKLELEKKTGQKVISGNNFLQKKIKCK